MLLLKNIWNCVNKSTQNIDLFGKKNIISWVKPHYCSLAKVL